MISIPQNEPPLRYLAYTLPPRSEDVRGEDVLDAFLEYVRVLGLELYPAQEEAILEIVDGKNVILNTPTGSGKSLVATAMHFYALAKGQRSFYTAPIKALVNEKFFALCRDFGPDNVGMMTGDAAVNREAPIICCTAEILSNMALREGTQADVGYAIIDEFHYYADRDRGVAWQIPLLALPQTTFLLMSATFGDAKPFEEKLTKLTDRPTAVVRSVDRPVPLDYDYRETPLHETVVDLVKDGRIPVYIVNFTQRACAEEAQNLLSVDYCTKEEKKAISTALHGVRFDTPYGKEIQKLVRHGIGIHHAGLLPKYRLLVEKLAQRGHLKIVVGTDTLGVGVNIPIRTVLFTKLCKFDGQKTAILSARDFHQISGRAGRKGFDDRGSVVVQAPEYVIENLRMDHKVANDPSKKKKLVKKRPPEKGYVHWDRSTFNRLVASQPEALVSKFQVNHGMLVNVLSRGPGGCRAMGRLIRDSHEHRGKKRLLGRTAMMMFQSLKDAGILEVGEDRSVVFNENLQQDFSLHQALSLYLVETIGLLELESPTYALDLLTLVESILENPDVILYRQLDKLKQIKLGELKAAGVEYDDRIAELEKMENPKPNAEFIYDTFNAFVKRHPWVDHENIRPKTIAREMFETFQAFVDYEKDYGLERSEGILLRYLSDVYKTLLQTVPAPDKTPELEEIIVYFGAIVRSIDSSLIDEWESIRKGELVPQATEEVEDLRTAADKVDITRDERAFMVLIRNALFSFLRTVERGDYEGAASMMEGNEEPWTAKGLQAAFAPFFEQHQEGIRLDPAARSPQNTRVGAKDSNYWALEQIVCDSEDDNDTALVCRVDIEKSRMAGHPVIELTRVEG